MQSVGIGKKELLALLIAGLTLTGVYQYYGDLQLTALFSIIACGSLLSLSVVLEKTFWFYAALVFFIPLSIDVGIAGGAQVNAPSELMLLLLLAVLILFHKDYGRSLKSTLKHPITLLLCVDLCWQLIVTLTSSQMDVSFKRWIIHAIFTIGFFTTISMLRNPKRVIQIWMAYAIGLIPAMWTAFRNLQHNDFNPRTVFSISKPFFPDHTIYGACLAFLIPLLILLCFHRKKLQWKRWQTIGLFLLTLFIIVSDFMALSRAAILSLVVAVIFALLLRWKMRFRGMVIGLSALLLITFSLQNQIYEYLEETEAVSNDGQVTNHLSSVTNIQTDASNMERVNRWVCAIRMFEDRPMLGFGPGTYQFEYNKYQTMEYKTYISSNTGEKGNAHSEYLTYLSEKGLLGAIIFLCIVFAALYFGMKNYEQLEDPLLRIINLGILLGLITYFFHGVFNSFMDQSKMAFLYFSALGTLVWLYQYRPTSKKGTAE